MSQITELMLRERCAIEGIGPADLVAKLEAENAELRREVENAQVNGVELDKIIAYLREKLGRRDIHSIYEGIDTAIQRAEKSEADTRRLDWLESRKTEVHFWNRNGNNRCSFIEDWNSDDPTEALLEAETLREAIDSAMREKPHQFVRESECRSGCSDCDKPQSHPIHDIEEKS